MKQWQSKTHGTVHENQGYLQKLTLNFPSSYIYQPTVLSHNSTGQLLNLRKANSNGP